ncbi:MAG: histidine phosphatase family protein [Clostridia bacterium]|nr:histidine phosphatase family protein [Clostridia bacterium]
MKIYMTRHGETKWNLEGKIQGRKNSDLTDLGRQQAEWLSEKLKDETIDFICTSPSGRAMETAKIINGDRNIPIETYDDLMEIDLGNWEGQHHVDIEKQFPEDFDHFWHHPERFVANDQESFEEIIERGRLILNEIIKKHQKGTVLIVAHAILLKGILAYVKGYSVNEFWEGAFMRATNLSLLEVNDDVIKILLEGDTSHYKPL